jgi:hypothetical protein
MSIANDYDDSVTFWFGLVCKQTLTKQSGAHNNSGTDLRDKVDFWGWKLLLRLV